MATATGAAGLLRNAGHAIAELPEALATASELSGYEGLIYVAAAFAEVAEYGALGALIGGTGGFVLGSTAVAASVYAFNAYHDAIGCPVSP